MSATASTAEPPVGTAGAEPPLAADAKRPVGTRAVGRAVRCTRALAALRTRGLVAQAARFALVGATNTALTLCAYWLLVLAGVPGPVAGAVGWALGAANGYRLNRGWTFRSALRGLTPAVRYVAVQAVGAGLDTLGVWLVVGDRHLHHLEGEVAILPAVTLLTFALCRGWVFA
jgi:putative flippase GtrA